jgi:hypothetical protein
MLVRREAFDRVGPFDEALEAADFVDWWTRAVLAGLRWQVPDVLVSRRRVHGRNQGVRRREEQRENDLDILKALLARRRAAGAEQA